MTPLGLTATDLLIVYLLPVAAIVAVWLTASLVVYALARAPGDRPLKHDLLRKIEVKQRLPSGRRVRMSYPYVASLLLGDNCVQATVLYRLSHRFARPRLRPVAEAIHAFSKFLTHLDVSPWAEIGPGVYFYHGLGTVIGKGTRIGRGALVCQGVTTGGGPRIGDDVKLWAGAKVIGRVTIGDRVEVGANAVVLKDVPSDSLAVGVPAEAIARPRETEPELWSAPA